jgi:hypothetical protein
MKRIIKNENSQIVVGKLNYPANAPEIRTILEQEQNGFCAYTEYRISAGFSTDVEHFNPNLKSSKEDNYNNWFAVSHKWNNFKNNKWSDFQPILYLTDKDFENRIFYDKEEAFYLWKENDIEAENLIKLLNLNNNQLVKERKAKIELLKTLFSEQEKEISFKKWLHHPKSKKNLIEFRRAIEEVFNINLENE